MTKRAGHLPGAACILISTTSFAVMAAVSKTIGARASSNEKLFWRGVVTGGLTLAGVLWRGAGLGRPRRPWLLLLRGLCGHAATVAYLESIERLPLAEAACLGKIHPLAAAASARLLLGEPLRPSRLAAIAASAGGAALVGGASAERLAAGSSGGVALALLAGALSGLAYCCVRALGRAGGGAGGGGEAEAWALLAFPLVSVPLGAPAAWAGAAHGAERAPWGWLLALGVSTHLGQLFLARGLQWLPAASGTQLMHLGSIVSVLLGVLLGDGWPGWNVWLGGSIIAGSVQAAESWDQRCQRSQPEHKSHSS